MSHDITSGVLTVALSYLGDFAFFAAIPTALDPAPEPGATPVQYYLPEAMSEASSVTSDSSLVTDVLYLPVANR